MSTSEKYGYAAIKRPLVRRLKRVEGQVRGISGMVEDDRYCIDILVQISAAQAALDKVALGLVNAHIDHCVMGAQGELREERTEELMGAVARLMRHR